MANVILFTHETALLSKENNYPSNLFSALFCRSNTSIMYLCSEFRCLYISATQKMIRQFYPNLKH